ncbi:MAG TPA: hypothetical protein VJI70_04150 [Candidatus Paceibacterota bacterium]
MTGFERKQVVVEVLLEIIKALSAVGPHAGMVGYWFGKLAEHLTKRTEELAQEMR